MHRDQRYFKKTKFQQEHGGRESFPGSEWGTSTEFAHNNGGSSFRESDSYDRRERPFDMDNYYSGRQFSVGGVDFERQDRQEGSWDSRPFHDSAFSSQGSFAGMGPKGYKRSDERIYDEACEALFHSPDVDASNIEVSVKNACITLTGTVTSRGAKRVAEDCVHHLAGVEDVHNQIVVTRSEANVLPSLSGDKNSDSELKENH